MASVEQQSHFDFVSRLHFPQTCSLVTAVEDKKYNQSQVPLSKVSFNDFSFQI